MTLASLRSAAAADVGRFAARLAVLDKDTVLRLQSIAGRGVSVWGWTPFGVLAQRGVPGVLEPAEVVVKAVDVVNAGKTTPFEFATAPTAAWRGALPPSRVTILDEIAADEVASMVAAAEETFRQASAIAANPQRAGTALLDHEVVAVTSGGGEARVRVRQLVIAARLGFLADQPVRVGLAGRWVVLVGAYGVTYCLPAGEGLNLLL